MYVCWRVWPRSQWIQNQKLQQPTTTTNYNYNYNYA